MPKTVSICGCGWLGLPLARALVRLGFAVKGSTTSPEKFEILKEYGIVPFQLLLDPHLFCPLKKEYFSANILVLTIPFRRNLADPGHYKEQISEIVAEIYSSEIEFVIFTSSTSVYPDKKGKVMEDEVIIPENERARVLLEIEGRLLTSGQFSATVIRFGGLYGYDRQPGRFLKDKISLSGGNKPVNLIHQDDCVEILAQMISQDIRGEVFNAVSDSHPTRKEVYVHHALRLGLNPPEFIDEISGGGKIISNQKLKDRLGYRFKHPDPLAD